MAISTLVLGLGGTGVLALRYLKTAYDRLPLNERVPVSFLGIDFDRSALRESDEWELARLGHDEFLYLRPDTLQEMALNIDRTIDDEPAWGEVLEWFPDRNEVQIPASDVEANGASQYRVLGRLGFFLNDELIESSIRSALGRLPTEIDELALLQRKRVMILSSTAGGTGAGMFIDAAYICRRQEGHPRVFAYLLLPEVFQHVDHGGRILQNSYAVLRELAHLKNQIVPFNARYYDIPQVEVSVGGEEPFARIFLFGRGPTTKRSPILEAAAQMVGATLAQLQRRIQEKTLAIVSNTVASARSDLRRWKQTHAFSGAGSAYLDLTASEIGSESLVKEVSRWIRDDQELAEIFQEDVQGLVRDLSHQLRGKETESKGEEVQSDSVSEEMEGQAEELAKTWKIRINRTASTGRQVLLNNIRTKVRELRVLANSRQVNRQQEVEEELSRFRQILLTDYSEENYEDNLAVLRRLTDFPEIDEDIRDLVSKLVLTTSKTLPAEEILKRKLLYERLRAWSGKFWVHFSESSSAKREALRGHWEVSARLEREGGRKPSWIPRWLWPLIRTRRVGEVKKDFLVAKSILLERALDDDALSRSLEEILKVRAYKSLKALLERELEKLSDEVGRIRQPWLRAHKGHESITAGSALPSRLRTMLRRRIRTKLPELMENVWREAHESEEAVDENRLHRLVEEHVLRDSELEGVRFLISTDKEDYEGEVLDSLVRCRQELFCRRTPNPQRKGFALLLVPDGILWPGGTAELHRFLEANAQQILECRAEVLPHDGKRIWVYFEDLFNPPEHIRNLHHYYHAYSSEEHPELFHVDRRFLELPNFREIVSRTATSVGCGNESCYADIADLPRSERFCPSCERPIRSRCGNTACLEDELHHHVRGSDRQCPSCGAFNHSAWWICSEHGKVDFEIPMDKVRCPKCITTHLEDPMAFPVSCISRRPDLSDSVACPRCETLEFEDAEHRTFWVNRELLPFYRDGVNGHDRERYLQLARKLRLPDSYRCPSCRTALIPVHHRKQNGDKAGCERLF